VPTRPTVVPLRAMVMLSRRFPIHPESNHGEIDSQPLAAGDTDFVCGVSADICMY